MIKNTKKCPVCNEQIPAKADFCIKCGFIFPRPRPYDYGFVKRKDRKISSIKISKLWWVLDVFIVLLLTALSIYLAYMNKWLLLSVPVILFILYFIVRLRFITDNNKRRFYTIMACLFIIIGVSMYLLGTNMLSHETKGRRAAVFKAKQTLQKVNESQRLYYEKYQVYPPMTLDVFGNGTIPRGMEIDSSINVDGFRFDILPNNRARAIVKSKEYPNLDGISPLFISDKGKITGGEIFTSHVPVSSSEENNTLIDSSIIDSLNTLVQDNTKTEDRIANDVKYDDIRQVLTSVYSHFEQYRDRYGKYPCDLDQIKPENAYHSVLDTNGKKVDILRFPKYDIIVKICECSPVGYILKAESEVDDLYMYINQLPRYFFEQKYKNNYEAFLRLTDEYDVTAWEDSIPKSDDMEIQAVIKELYNPENGLFIEKVTSECSVKVEVIIDTSGYVEATRIHDVFPKPLEPLVKYEAKRVARNYQFYPARTDDGKVKSRKMIELIFYP